MEELEKLKSKNNELYSSNCELEREKEKLTDAIIQLKIENIAELKASKILFKMVKDGYTHKAKNQIANYANIVLDCDINEKIQELKDFIKPLPF